MGKVWVLDTGTKGTGASVVPLESTLVKPAPAPKRPYVPPKPAPPKPKEPEPRQPPRFKVVDVMSGEVLTDGADGRATLDVLRGVRSNLDVRVYRWHAEKESWRLLTLGEQRSLWHLRDRAQSDR
jgi:hypothetical protein